MNDEGIKPLQDAGSISLSAPHYRSLSTSEERVACNDIYTDNYQDDAPENFNALPEDIKQAFSQQDPAPGEDKTD
jgi:hypothetical protein